MTTNSLVRGFLLAGLLALGLAAPAGAQTIAEGRLTLQLDRGLRASLHRQGAKLRGVNPAVGRIDVINLPLDDGGGLEPSGKGRLLPEGGIQFGAKGRRATFRDLILDTAFGTLSATLDRRRLALATTGGLSSERRGFGAELGLRRLTLTRAAAAAIDSGLGMPGLLRGGEALGSATAVARFDELTVLDGRTLIAFDQGFGEKLKSLKITTKALGDTGLAPGWPTVWIPDMAGEAALDLSGGSVRSADGFALRQFESPGKVTVRNIELYFGARLLSARLEAKPAGSALRPASPLGTLDFGTVNKNAYTGEIYAPNSPVPMSAELASVLNETFVTPKGLPPLFEAGEPFAQVTVSLETR